MSVSGGTAALVADDLTGASDAAVQFARTGWDARLLLSAAKAGGPTAGTSTLYATTTDARAATLDQAERLTAEAFQQAAARGATRFYLKIDSTMRGSLPGQINGALAGLSAQGEDAAVVLCPAYPSMGRSVTDGVLTVHGVPVAETPLRNDPATPVLHSDVREIVPGATHLAVSSVPGPDGSFYQDPAALRIALEAAYASGERILVADAVTDADLTILAAAIVQARVPLLPAGSAGLAVALARLWEHSEVSPARELVGGAPRGRHLLQISSLNPVSTEQVERLKAHDGFDVVMVEPPLPALRSPEATGNWLQDFLEGPGAAATCVASDDTGMPLSAAQAENGNDSTAPMITVIAAPHERLPSADARRVAAGLGEITAALLRTGAFARAGLIGGDGALAALHTLECGTLRVLDSIEEGIPLALAADGAVPGLPIFTKAGGFGTGDSLVHAVTAMHDLTRHLTR